MLQHDVGHTYLIVWATRPLAINFGNLKCKNGNLKICNARITSGLKSNVRNVLKVSQAGSVRKSCEIGSP